MTSPASSPATWRRRDVLSRSDSRPPNLPLRRSIEASSRYNTFRNNANNLSGQASSCPILGLSTLAARKHLLQSIEYKIHEKESSSNGTTEFRDPFSLLLALCATFRFIDAVRCFANMAWDRGISGAKEGFLFVAAAVVNVLLNMTQKHRQHAEMAERVRVAVRQMLQKNRDKRDEGNTDMRSPIRLGSRPEPTVLLPSNSYVACYRDNQWIRLPMNLLVEGDVVGLMSGDIAPGDVRPVKMSTAEQYCAYARGCKLPSWTQTHAKNTTRCTATFDPPLLLEMCGEMQIYEMLETPVLRDIEDALFRINRPITPTQKLQVQARQLAVYICTLYTILVLLAIGLRVVVQHRSLETLLTHILLGPIGIWMCFASLNTPLIFFVAEAAATASILGSFDDILAPKGLKTPDHEQDAENSHKDCRDDETRPEASIRSNQLTMSTLNLHKQMSRIDGATTSILKAIAFSPPDIYDVEDREQLRSEIAQKQSATMRSLQYFLVVLQFRVMHCELAHVSDRRLLPVPLRSFRLLERLGNITMLCCFDDDILCEQTPSVEEIFLLNDKQSNNSTVLDLHAERNCDTGLQFEDPKWKQHLPSLKPIGLAIMVNDNEHAAQHYEDNMRYLVNETQWSGNDCGSAKDPYLRSCMQRLSAHIRMLPFPKHLLKLSREMGFSVADDLTMFQRRQSIHIICPRLAHNEHLSDHHDQGQEDTRYRGNLKSHLYSTVVLDKRSHRHQLLSRGHPTVVLARCSEYWDGKSICPLSSDKQCTILDMYNQWRAEDLDCIAFSYVPVSSKLNSLFNRSGSNGNGNSFLNSPGIGPTRGQQGKPDGPLPPVYLVDGSAASEIKSPRSVAARNSIPLTRSMNKAYSQEYIRTSHFARPLSPSHSVDDTSRDQGFLSEPRLVNSVGTPRSGQITPPPKRRGHLTISDVESSGGLNPSETSSVEKDSMLWRIQDDQIFLGMVATGVQPKQHTPDFIEDLDACGIRFVYFSPRNMRRSKLLAEKMGIETDWNCAISLRPLDSDGPDPHRMTSNYSDWDVKARLPHGVEAIKRHLAEVDNVPLLVSLYTDSTPDTISEMISIFQENHEVVMGVGSSLKESNAPLFSKADLAVALQGGVNALFGKPISHGKELPVFSDVDIQFSHILNTLACAFRLNSSSDDANNQRSNCLNTNNGNATVTGTASVAHLIELIRLGRRMLTNFHQMSTFIFVSQLFIGTIILVSYAIPFPHVSQLTCASIFWLSWVLVPALSLSMLASATEKGIMKKTPRKNEEFDLKEDLTRLTAYFIGRHMPSALLSLAVYECLLGFSLEASSFADPNAFGDAKFQGYRWTDFVLDNDLVTKKPRPAAVVAAVDRAEAGMLLMIGICIVTSSCGYLYRCESIFKQSPFRNIMWVTTACVLLCLQCILSLLRAGIIGADGVTLWHFVSQSVPQIFWVVIFGVWPFAILGLDEAIKTHDKRHYVRYNKFLRMQFDTRLGMWSPK